jgi:4-hydroxybenzoate polyprenyltransferase
MLPYVGCLVAAGFGWAHWDRALVATGLGGLLAVLAAWAALHAGTLWLNAALDRDQGAVLFGRAAPVPDVAVPAGRVALAAGVALAAAASPAAGLAAVGCAVLAVAYSDPRVAWKGHPLGGPVVNFVGYGLLTPMAGWSAVGVDPNPRTLVVWVLGAIGVLGAYFAAQAFQRDEDAARGYRTLVVTHGPRAAIVAARVCLGLGALGAIALSVAGFVPRVCALAAPAWWVVDRYLAAWAVAPDVAGADRARGLARRLLLAGWLVVGLAFVDYARASFAGEPVAGLATARGLPGDRPALPPRLLREWEAATRSTR